MVYFCPICGCKLENDFNQYYVICPCCGNQGNVNDDINKKDFIKQDEEKYYRVLMELKELIDNRKDVPREMRDYLELTVYTKEEAWTILREEWINKGYTWVNDDKPAEWNEEMAKKQLENINIYI